MTLEQGALLRNRYRIIEVLGHGGMGSIYRAVDENLGVEVAVKENLFTVEDYTRQFKREATILANLRHPNLPRVSNHFSIPDQGQYLIMDYIEGEDLQERMERQKTIPEEEVITIGSAICDALTYMHSQDPQVLHRDIKPGNVRITPKGDIYLVDFGLAKVMRGNKTTTTGARAMTMGFSPPEQYGAARTDTRTDIYSLGATLYTALTGSTPEDSLAQTMDQEILTPVRERKPSVSRRVAEAVEKALQVHPNDRFQMASEFKNELLKAKSGRFQFNFGMEEKLSPPPEAGQQAHGSGAEKDRVITKELAGSGQGRGRQAGRGQKDPSGLRLNQKGCLSMASFLILILILAGTVLYLIDPALALRLLGL